MDRFQRPNMFRHSQCTLDTPQRWHLRRRSLRARNSQQLAHQFHGLASHDRTQRLVRYLDLSESLISLHQADLRLTQRLCLESTIVLDLQSENVPIDCFQMASIHRRRSSTFVQGKLHHLDYQCGLMFCFHDVSDPALA